MHGTRRRLFFSSAFTELKTTPLHCQIPLTLVKHGLWLNLAIHVADLVAACFRGATFRSMDLLTLSAYFKLRRVFTLRQPPPDSTRYLPGCENIPRSLDYPGGCESITQVGGQREGRTRPAPRLPAIHQQLPSLWGAP